MSTKIYNGFRINGDTDLFDFRKKVTDELKPYILAEITSHAVQSMIFDFDGLTIKDGLLAESTRKNIRGTTGGLTSDKLRFHDLYWSYFAKEREDSESDYVKKNAHLTLTYNARVNKIFVLINAHNNVIEAFEKMDGVEKYPYWNNSDRPDEISGEEWKTRGKEWNEVLELMKDTSLNIQVLETYVETIRYSYFREYDFDIPSDSARLAHLASEFLALEYMRKTPEKLVNSQAMISYFMDSDNRDKAVEEFRPYLKPLTREGIRRYLDEKNLTLNLI